MSFYKITEAISSLDDLEYDSSMDKKALEVILRGLEQRPDRTSGRTFWDDFISVFGSDIEGVSRLLNVKPSRISKWLSLVKEGLEEVRRKNLDQSKRKERAKLMPTGKRH